MVDIQVKKRCFVIGPIGSPGSSERVQADWLFKGIIQPVFRENFADFEVERADTITTPGLIDQQIIQRLFDVDLVIADLSFLNANAFYELGIRHMAVKPTIHMCSDDFRIPFDVALYRAILFSIKHPDDLEKAKGALIPAIEDAIDPDHEIVNPITLVRGRIKADQTATTPERIILDRLDSLEERLVTVQRVHETVGQDRSASNSSLSQLFVEFGRMRPDTFYLLESICKRVIGDYKIIGETPSSLIILTAAGDRKINDLLQKLSRVDGIVSVTSSLGS